MKNDYVNTGWTSAPKQLRDWTVKQRLESVLETLADQPAYNEQIAAKAAVLAALEAAKALQDRMAEPTADAIFAGIEADPNWIGGKAPTSAEMDALAIKATSGKLPHVKRIRGTWNTYEREL